MDRCQTTRQWHRKQLSRSNRSEGHRDFFRRMRQQVTNTWDDANVRRRRRRWWWDRGSKCSGRCRGAKSSTQSVRDSPWTTLSARLFSLLRLVTLATAGNRRAGILACRSPSRHSTRALVTGRSAGNPETGGASSRAVNAIHTQATAKRSVAGHALCRLPDEAEATRRMIAHGESQ